MNMGCVSHLRVAPRFIAMRSVQGRLYQRGHALIMKTAMDNVTLSFRNCTFHRACEPIVNLLSFSSTACPCKRRFTAVLPGAPVRQDCKDRLALSLPPLGACRSFVILSPR